MRPKTVVCALVALAGVLPSVTAASPPAYAAPSAPSVLCVNPHGKGCYQSIQQAVNAAAAGAQIEVAAGTYSGAGGTSGVDRATVTITKPLTLHGAGGNSVVDATGQAHGILIDGAGASGTVVSGFTVQHADREGILVRSTSHVTVERNTVQVNDMGWVAPLPGAPFATCPGANFFDQDDCGEGLHLNGVASSVVADNLVQKNVGGILLTDEAGATHDNLVTRNTVQDNDRDCGITLPSHPSSVTFGPGGPVFGPGHGVYHNTVSDNVSRRNGGAGVGIFAPTPGTAAYENTVIGNTLTDNGLPGVALHSHVFGQNLNGNRIIGNTISGNAADDDANTGGKTGIVIFSDAAGHAAPITGMTITNNTVSGEDIDVWIGTTALNLALHDNNLLGSGMVGVQNAGAGTIDATNNYWDCPTGPGTSGCSTVKGTVNVAPWLTHRAPSPANLS